MGWSAVCSERGRERDENHPDKGLKDGYSLPQDTPSLLSFSLIVSHTDSVAAGLGIGLTNDQSADEKSAK